MWHDYDIDFARWLHTAMWHVALESRLWIHQVAAPCNVIRRSVMTCHWICPNARHIGILHLVSISTTISTTSSQSTCHSAPSPKFYPNRTNVGRKQEAQLSLTNRAMLVCQDFLSEYVDKKFTYICYRWLIRHEWIYYGSKKCVIYNSYKIV